MGMTVGLVIAESLGEGGSVNGTQTLPQPSTSSGHRAKGETSESSAFCHPGSCVLGCKLSVHLT